MELANFVNNIKGGPLEWHPLSLVIDSPMKYGPLGIFAFCGGIDGRVLINGPIALHLMECA